jgi:predicted DNA-binding transcriptional regulator AlpA
MSTHHGTGGHDRLIGFDEVHRRVELSRATLWRLRKQKLFPDPVQVSPGRRLWSEQSINDWIAKRLKTA